MKLKQIIDSHQSINKLSSLNLPDLNLKFPEIRKIMKLVSKVNEEYQIFQKSVNDLIYKHGKINEKTGKPEIETNSVEFIAYDKDFKEIVDSEIELEFDPIELKVDATKLNLTMQDLINLEIFFNWG